MQEILRRLEGSGLTYRKLDWYARQEVFASKMYVRGTDTIARGDTGTGFSREIPEDEIYVVALLAKASELNVPLKIMRAMLEAYHDEIINQDYIYLMVAGNGSSVMFNTVNDLVRNVEAQGGNVWLFNIDEIHRSVS